VKPVEKPRPPPVVRPTPPPPRVIVKRPEPKPEKPRRKFKLGRLPDYYFIAAAAVTVAAGATTVAMGLQTDKYHDDYWQTPTRSTRDKGLTFMNATNAMIGLTAVAGAATVALAIFTDWSSFKKKKESATGVNLQPILGPRTAGLTISSGF
jgi:hypothetical protein